ncbi:heterogeneous nuclear ribonucleoprotein U-like protein 1 [Bradysia coprophila]|uniref:heterogeneous nuclear ribonucleoprotein U-like protein 1 n=1 Tax=Bradysia coprophila TaxID=38358 RepID=UPI00187D6EBC|nr:heterogeneous nuclear ribonucleoprotein U-like protein 1 [Bradysia coprophila]
MDPAKLKVVELRQELASRGLDQKGVKAVLVARLTEALESENAETPNSVSSESGESEQSSVEVPTQQIEAVAESVIENDNQPEEDEEMPIEQEAEKTIVSAEPVGTKTVEAAAEVPTETSDPVPITEVQQPSAVTEDEPMDEDSNIEQKIESTIADDDKLKDDVRQPNVEHIEENVTAALGEAADPEEVKEEESTKSEAEPAKPEVDVETKMESCDDERTSVTQSEDNKRESESDSDRTRKRKRSRSKSSSPTVKRSRRASPVQNTDDFTNVEDEPEIDASAVLLSWFDSDLNLKVNSSEFLSARPISEGPLHMAWAGVRATHGVKSGKVSYEILIDDLYRIRGQYDRNPNEIRCGWSVKTSSLQLGEAPLSFGYGGSGKKSLNNEFTDYGCKFRNRGDVIGVYLDLDSTPCKIEYTVNGESQGVAFEFEKSELGDEALYPHILSKNTGFKVNFGGMEKSFVSKIKPKSHRDERDDRDDRRDSRRDRRSDRDSRRDRDSRSRSRSRSRSQSRSRGDRKEKSDEEEKPPATNDEKPAEGDAENPTNDVDTAETAVSTSQENSDEPVAEEKAEEKSMDVVKSDENAADADGANGDSQPKDAEEEVPVEKTMLPGYEFIGKLSSEQLIPGFSRPESRKECEIILLIGLPGSGKTYWANNFVNENIDKHFNILGIQPLLSKMTISGEPRKKHVDMKWDRFIDSCIRGVNIIQDIAAKRRRNYIIDQTNVISQNQRRKIRGFGDFKRSAVVFIPEDEEYKQRLEKKIENEGKEVSEYSSDDMKANFSIPNSGCWFDEVKFVGLEGEEAKNKVVEYNEQGKKALSTHQSSYNRGSRDYNRPRRDDFRDNRDRDRRWGGGDRRYDNRSDWRSQNWRGGGGGYGGSRDRWHGGSGGGGGGNWANNYRGNNRYDDRGYRGGGGYSRNRDFGHDRDRRDDRARTDSRGDHRDFRDGNRDRRGEDKRRHDRGVPQREKDVKQLKPQPSQVNYKSTKTEPPTQGHWNPNVVGPNANNWNNYYQQQQQQQQQPQNWGEYNQQNWMQQQQQWSQQQAQPSNNYTTQQAHQVQDWSNWQQQTQQPPPTSQQPSQPQQDVTHAGWQNWAQHAQAYGNVGDQSAPK